MHNNFKSRYMEDINRTMIPSIGAVARAYRATQTDNESPIPEDVSDFDESV